jgi:chemotaxis protein methyltransferase CheR
MEDLILKRIGGLIAAHSGIHVREQDYPALAKKLWQRTRALGLSSLDSYYNLLLKELETGISAQPQHSIVAASHLATSEWQELYAILTINESYFFRDKNQFQLLRDKLLPEIIERKRTDDALGQKSYAAVGMANPFCAFGVQVVQRAKSFTPLPSC